MVPNRWFSFVFLISPEIACAEHGLAAFEASELAPERAAPVRPVRQVLVLDGGWRELLGNKWRKRYEQKPGLNMTHD